MSKRFGRNQKRRAREALADLQERLNDAQSQILHVARHADASAHVPIVDHPLVQAGIKRAFGEVADMLAREVSKEAGQIARTAMGECTVHARRGYGDSVQIIDIRIPEIRRSFAVSDGNLRLSRSWS